MSRSLFLELPRELRDIIFEYATSEGNERADNAISRIDSRTQRLPFGSFNAAPLRKWEWNVRYPSVAPISPCTSLSLCSRQLNDEINDFLNRRKEDGMLSKLTLVLCYPDLTPTWTHYPAPPHMTRTLDLLVKVDYMYHPVFINQGAHNAILYTVFEVLKRYIHRGPHLSKPSPLVEPLQLDVLRITVAPPMPFEDMTHVYGWPAQQLEDLFTQFKAVLCRFARSGIPFGSVGALEIRVERKEWHRFPVTSNIWNEEDYVLFNDAGYKWNAGESLVH